MSLLSAITSVCRRVGIGVPTSVVRASDDLTLQLLELANESAEELGRRHGWSKMRVLRSFPTVAAQVQTGALPDDYDRMAPGRTLWNQTQRLPLVGPLSAADWARLTNLQALGQPRLAYRLQGGALLLYPVPAAGQVISFEYVSNCPVVAADGVTVKPAFTADDDAPRFSEDLLVKDVRWRWKAAKGLNYNEELAAFERAYELAAGSDRGEIEIGMASNGADTLFEALPDTLWPGTILGPA